MEIQDCLSLWNVTGTSEIHRPEGLTAVNVISRKAPVNSARRTRIGRAAGPMVSNREAGRVGELRGTPRRLRLGGPGGRVYGLIIGGNKFRPLAAIYYQDRVCWFAESTLTGNITTWTLDGG